MAALTRYLYHIFTKERRQRSRSNLSLKPHNPVTENVFCKVACVATFRLEMIVTNI